MQARGKAAAAKNPQADERGLQEKGQQGLDGQGGTENIAHEDGVRGPVEPELELEDNARHDAHGHLDKEQAAEITAQAVPTLVTALVSQRLHQCHQKGEPDRERDEKEMEHRYDAELPARQEQLHQGSDRRQTDIEASAEKSSSNKP